jgi:uncharacterized protein
MPNNKHDVGYSIGRLIEMVRELYLSKRRDVPFHGWHHVSFVLGKATEFAKELGADVLLVQAAALTHDLNYLVKGNSEPEAGEVLRKELLKNAGFANQQLGKIESIIREAHTATRGRDISHEGMALSDADTLYKALPVTPILFSNGYLVENGISLRELAEKILSEQRPLRENNIDFYTDSALRYQQWADVNFSLWENVLEAIKDEDVQEMLRLSGFDI